MFLAVVLVSLSAPAFGQARQQPAPVTPPLQALGNILRYPQAPPPPPQTGTSRPLSLPTAIPPNGIGTVPSTPGR